MLSESVQRNGQIAGAIFTYLMVRSYRDAARGFRYSSGPAGHYGQFTQRGDAIRERGVCAEQRGQSAATKPRFYDT
jgi:hypothetical protein